jgi:hypothetical protein
MVTGKITFQVPDPQKLWDSATKEFVGPRAAGDPEDIERVFGTRDNPNVDNCLRELYWSDDDQETGMTLWNLTEVS